MFVFTLRRSTDRYDLRSIVARVTVQKLQFVAGVLAPALAYVQCPDSRTGPAGVR
jgi:hypothetical protein